MAGETFRNEADMLRLVVEGTAAETGGEFFRSLVRNLAAVLGTLGAWVTEYLPNEGKLRALAMWLRNGFVEDYEYMIEGTACQSVVEQRTLIHIPDRLIELFPRDDDLVPLQAVSYLGAPLLDADGSVMGHLSVLDDKPMPRDERAVALFRIFAARATAEHRRVKIEQDIRAREEQMSAVLATTMDAILVLREEMPMRVDLANRAAVRLFGGHDREPAHRSVHELLTPESVDRLGAFARELAGRPPGDQHLWVPQDLVARRLDGTVFPAEATVSRFEIRGIGFLTLILRNIDDRRHAERRIERLTQETAYLRETVRELGGQDHLLGQSDGMKSVAAAIERVAETDSTVLITGETGTGKELVARSLHRNSRRKDAPLILVNCAAIPANLIESEFFGHERGAFTGAVARREGRFALADGGTLFLDEIGELPLELQPKLLRVLQEGEFEPLGSSRTVKVDVRVIAATHRDLRRKVAEGTFREDLYFRLNVFPIVIPPLRDRGADLDLLAQTLVQRLSRRLGRLVPPLTADQLDLLRAYDWPGNVRELQNVMERAIILSSNGRLALEHAMAGLATRTTLSTESRKPADETSPSRVLKASELLELERRNILRALQSCGGRVAGEHGAARLLGIPASTLQSRMKALGVHRPGSRPSAS